MGATKADLFDEDSDQEDRDADPSHLRVNEEYAKRFEHNRKRAELHRLQEKHPEVAARIQARRLDAFDDGDESSSSEEEDEGQLSPETEHEWAQALLKIRKKDPSLYDASTSLFHEASAPESGGTEAAPDQDVQVPKKKSKKTLRDILYDQAIAETEGQEDDNIDTDIDRKRRLRAERSEALAYDTEQRALRDALVSRMNSGGEESDAEARGSGDEDDLGGLTVRQRATDNATDRAGDVPEAAAAADLDKYFGTGGDVTGGDATFLREYFKRRLWEEPGDDGGESTGAGLLPGPPAAPDSMAAVDEDEEFLTRADRFEHRYNFRSEEPGGTEIRSYPRQIEGLARQEESKRKRQRDSKRVRQEERDQQRAAEVKQLKNLKKQEVGDAISQLAAVSGKGAPGKKLLKQLMDTDFDPDAWDQHMASAFGDDYYAEAEPEMDIVGDADNAMREAQQWKGDDGPASEGEADESDDDGDGEKDSMKTFDAVHRKLTGKEAELLPETDYAEKQGDGDGDVSSGDSGSEDDAEDGKVEKLAETRDKIHTLLQDYYNLDHEDEVGGIKTRFRYRHVEPINDGLSTEQILALPDRDLNAIVGLRKYAPYHQDVTRIRPNYKALNEAREKLVAQGLIKQRDASRGKKPFKKAGGAERKYTLGTAAKGEGKGVVGVAQGGVEKKTVSKQKKAGPKEGAAKVKRPGPRLRKALKEEAAAAAAEAGGGQVAGGEAEGKQAHANAQEVPAGDGDGVGAQLGGGHSGGKKHRKVLKEMTAEEKQEARLASYAPVVKAGFSGHASASKQHKAKQAAPVTDASGTVEDGPLAGLTKAAKKNMKRKMKKIQATAKPAVEAAGRDGQ